MRYFVNVYDFHGGSGSVSIGRVFKSIPEASAAATDSAEIEGSEEFIGIFELVPIHSNDYGPETLRSIRALKGGK